MYMMTWPKSSALQVLKRLFLIFIQIIKQVDPKLHFKAIIIMQIKATYLMIIWQNDIRPFHVYAYNLCFPTQSFI